MAKASENDSASDELHGADELMVTKRQINQLRKAQSLRKGADIKISKTKSEKLSNMEAVCGHHCFQQVQDYF